MDQNRIELFSHPFTVSCSQCNQIVKGVIGKSDTDTITNEEVKVFTNEPITIIRMMMSSAGIDENEAVFYFRLRLTERNETYASAFDKLIISANLIATRYMWALSCFKTQKSIANTAISEMRGLLSSVGRGVPCKQCSNTNTTIRPIQTNSGDEPTKIEITCYDCHKSTIVG